MSDTELLPCFCGYRAGDCTKKHERACPAYYREAVAEDRKRAVEEARMLLDGAREAIRRQTDDLLRLQQRFINICRGLGEEPK